MSIRFLPLAFMAAIVAVLPFVLGLGGDFVFDDRQTIVNNEWLRLASGDLDGLLHAAYSYQAGHGSRALAMLTFAFDYARGGMDPSVFKTTNLAVHAITILVIAVFFRLLLTVAGWTSRRATGGSIALALVWGLHPLQISTVLYVVQRMQMLGTLFLVAALWAYIHMRLAQIAGQRSRRYVVLTILFWGLALASKEDSALLPVYTMLLEVTFFRFGALEVRVSRVLRNAYLALVVVAALAYLLVVVPHYWHWDAYPGRAFSTPERLLTQARVLALYMGQIVLPLPERLPFYYDDLPISRGLLDPPSTLAALLLVVALIALAWRLRSSRPLFSFGVLLFFAGHFITSNVVNLELAFEHRNHFPLIGAVLALADIVLAACRRRAVRPVIAMTAAAGLVAALGAATAVRAYQWGDPTRFAETGVRIAPRSERAWMELCTRYFDSNDGKPNSPYIDRAIEACGQGAAVTQSPLLQFNVIIYKTFKGRPTREDWPLLIARLRRAPMSPEVVGVYQAILTNIARDFPMDPEGTTQAVAIIAERLPLSPTEYISIATFVYNNGPRPDAALPYLEQAVEAAPAGSPVIDTMFRNLSAAGQDEWVAHLKALPRRNSIER